MSEKQNSLTDKEMEDLQSITTDTLASVCTMADKHNIDRDSMLKYFADMLTAFIEVASIQNYEASHTCNCQHNSNSRDNEPCCRCDSRQTNADRIRNMSDEELASVLFSGCIDSMDLEECPYASEGELDNNKIRKICKKCTLDWLQSEVKAEESEEK